MTVSSLLIFIENEVEILDHLLAVVVSHNCIFDEVNLFVPEGTKIGIGVVVDNGMWDQSFKAMECLPKL